MYQSPYHNTLEAAILRTVAWFHLFSYALTPFEIWKWLYQETDEVAAPTLAHIRHELENNSHLRDVLTQEHGCYFLANTGTAPQQRFSAWVASEYKYRKVRRFTKLFSAIPWVEGVAICNSLGFRNARKEDDIDLFILVAPGRVWLTRFFVTGALALLHQRPTPTRTKDTFCASFFLTSTKSDLQPYLLQNSDPYMYYWIKQLTIVFERRSAFSQFFQQNRLASYHSPHEKRSTTYTFSSLSLFNKLERAAEKWQRGRLPRTLKEQAQDTATGVVLSSTILKFHDKDKRAEYRERWEQVCENLPIA